MALGFDDIPGRRRRRPKSHAEEEPWPSKSEPLSWTLLPPEDPEEGDDEAPPAAPAATPKESSTGTSTAAEKGSRPATTAPATETEPEEDWKTRYQYLLADFENYRKRVHKETEAAAAAARGKILLKVVDLHDGIEGALHALPPEAKAMREGLRMILRNFDALLNEEGAERVAHLGARFQHEVHEAVGQVPAGPHQAEGTIAVIVQQGYRTASGLLRPAKVLVVAAKEPTAKREKDER